MHRDLENPVLGQGGFGDRSAEFTKVKPHSGAVHSAIKLQARFLGFGKGYLQPPKADRAPGIAFAKGFKPVAVNQVG